MDLETGAELLLSSFLDEPNDLERTTISKRRSWSFAMEFKRLRR